MLKKEFNFLEKFPTLNENTFGDSKEKVKYFGIEPDTEQVASKNIEILFYNSKEDFAIKLKTKEGEEVYLYRTTGENKSFEENYKEMQVKQSKYNGEKTWNKNDILNIPFIKVKDEINYDELCGRYIKNTDWYIAQALQTIDVMNLSGSKKVKDIFIDEKVPMSKRDSWPIVVDSNNNIVWIPALKKSKYNKSNDEKCDIIIKYDN